MVNYLFVSLQMNDISLIYNGIFKRKIMIPIEVIHEVELEGPSQFNSNYMLVFYDKNKQKLGRLPIYWFSRTAIVHLLKFLQEKKLWYSIKSSLRSF